MRWERRSHLHLHGGGELSNAASEPSVAAGARPASADRLVPARSSLPGSLPCLSPGTDGERRAKEEREGNSSLFGAWHEFWV